MGVMSCSKRGCDNIMCDTYVNDIGYICYSCKEEFKTYLNKENIKAETAGEIRKVLETFMKIRKDYYTSGNEMSIDEFFESYTRE